MALYGLQGFLGKFAKLLRSEVAQKQIIQNLLRERFKVELDKNCILVKDGIVTIKAHPALKQRIYMEKNKIIEELSSHLPKGTVRDIR